MAKKKRQGEPAQCGNSEESSESSEERHGDGLPTGFCNHIQKSVDLSSVKKAFVVDGTTTLRIECNQCVTPVSAGSMRALFEPPMDTEDVDQSLWMCLKCGHLGCGRYRNKHAISHHLIPHSDPHSICLNMQHWSVWCYLCDQEVPVNAKGKLTECVEYIKRLSTRPSSAPTSDQTKTRMSLLPNTKPLPAVAVDNRGRRRVRGLVNLGNTCFFNSVMQCLGQTPFLLNLLQETSRKGYPIKLPGGIMKIHEHKIKKVIELAPLEGELEEWNPLTRVLAATLNDLQSDGQNILDPRPLFHELTHRVTQFSGGDQHDAHELLRHLLEAVREEDQRRYQRVILEKLGFSTKVDPATVEDDVKKIIRHYASQATELLPTEQVFRGVLVSTIMCQDCGHKSHRHENFLDLSLSIAEKPRAQQRRKTEDNNTDRRMSKKDRRQAKKVIAKSKRSSLKRAHPSQASNDTNKGSSLSLDMPVSGRQPIRSGTESETDLEDNASHERNSARTPEDSMASKGTESGYNSDKYSPDNVSSDVTPETSASSPAVMLSTSPVTPTSPDISPISSDGSTELESPTSEHNSPVDNNDLERPQSRLSFSRGKHDLKVGLEKLSIRSETNAGELEGACGGALPFEDVTDIEDEQVKCVVLDEHTKLSSILSQMDVDNDDISGATISKPVIAEGESSILSCLNQFTTTELLTGNNRVACAHCTKRRTNDSAKKTVYTDATVQLLIYSPPAVLILHLKRFQVSHYRPSKIYNTVKFPKQLDITPFCSRSARKLPTFDRERNQVLYSLYAVVEHNGSLHGGHYVAYIKLRPKADENNDRWRFLPMHQREQCKRAVEESVATEDRWFYVSDILSSEIPESRVLESNAYLLFYERIV